MVIGRLGERDRYSTLHQLEGTACIECGECERNVLPSADQRKTEKMR